MPKWVVAVAVLALGCKSEDKAALKAAPRETPRDAAQLAPPDPYTESRLDMVERTIARRGITDPRVITAMRLTPRHEFVSPDMKDRAYEDRPLPIYYDKTISQAYIVAAMTEAAQVKPGDVVLEIGTGSGYQAAVLAVMGAKVYTIEIHEDLAKLTRETLDRAGFRGVSLRSTDGYDGWPEAAPFDAIIVTCAAPRVPEPLLAQLKVGGRMVIPVGVDEQVMEVITKTADGVERKEIMDVRFGPMVGKVEVSR